MVDILRVFRWKFLMVFAKAYVLNIKHTVFYTLPNKSNGKFKRVIQKSIYHVRYFKRVRSAKRDEKKCII